MHLPPVSHEDPLYHQNAAAAGAEDIAHLLHVPLHQIQRLRLPLQTLSAGVIGNAQDDLLSICLEKIQNAVNPGQGPVGELAAPVGADVDAGQSQPLLPAGEVDLLLRRHWRRLRRKGVNMVPAPPRVIQDLAALLKIRFTESGGGSKSRPHAAVPPPRRF